MTSSESCFFTVPGMPATSEKGDDRVLKDDGARSNDGTPAHTGTVHHHRAHADEAALFNGAAMENGSVPYRDIPSDGKGLSRVHVQHGEVLDVGTGTNGDGIAIAPDDGIEPDGALLG